MASTGQDCSGQSRPRTHRAHYSPRILAESAALAQLDGEGFQSGELYPLGEKEVRFGRITGDFIFPDDGLMSRTHARLFRRGNDYLVEDLASRNGTFVKVRGRARIPLQARVWLGGEYFCFVQAPE